MDRKPPACVWVAFPVRNSVVNWNEPQDAYVDRDLARSVYGAPAYHVHAFWSEDHLAESKP